MGMGWERGGVVWVARAEDGFAPGVVRVPILGVSEGRRGREEALWDESDFLFGRCSQYNPFVYGLVLRPLGMDDLWTDVRAMSPLGKYLIVHLRNTSALRLRMDGPCPISEASYGVSWR